MSQTKNPFTVFTAPRNQQAKAKAAYLQEMFSGISPSYDRLNRLLSLRFDVSWRRRLVAESGLGPGGRVLDVCTGTGDLLFEFGRRVPGCQGEGLDFSEGMLEVARQKDASRGFRFIQGDALKMPFAPQRFDAVCMAFGLRNVVDLVKAFREMARVTRPGGKVLALELTRPQGLLLKALYLPYLHFYLPLVGRLVSGDAQAYRYLRDSIQGFFEPAQVLGFMAKGGLPKSRAIPLSGGLATLYVGEVPGRKLRGGMA
jgi:demethylmenaquinone methyltransferase/2-methoxy-6-polyprenyl-1,4-benzoquinol methylase